MTGLGEHAFVTVALGENEGIGALTLGQSLKQSGTNKKTCVIVDNLRRETLASLASSFDVVKPLAFDPTVSELISTRPDLKHAMCKLQCWRLTQFSKCVYMEPSCLALDNIDELFDRGELSAAPDTHWPDHFNCGVMVLCPSEATYSNLVEKAMESMMIDVSFQGIVNGLFSGWSTEDISKHLPFIYNVTPNVFYTYQPAIRSFKDSVKVVQFVGEPKPWNSVLNVSTGSVSHVSGEQQAFFTAWWNVFNKNVKPILDRHNLQCIQVSQRIEMVPYQPLQQVVCPVGSASDASNSNMKDWESGHIDYLGKDSFENIQQTLDRAINK